MSSDFLPVNAQTYDVVIKDVQPSIVFEGLEQTEVMKLLSLLPKAQKKYYSINNNTMDIIVSVHKKEEDNEE